MKENKLFIFDLGGVTLFVTDSLLRICKEFSLSYETLSADYKRYFIPLTEGYMDPVWYTDHVKSFFGVDIGEDIMRLVFRPYGLNRFILSKVKELREKGHRAVIGSNTFAPHWLCMEEDGIPSYFDASYPSHLIHLMKPDKEFYQYIMNKEGYSPCDTFFIDDLEENIATARALGINVFNYDESKNKELSSAISAFLGEK